MMGRARAAAAAAAAAAALVAAALVAASPCAARPAAAADPIRVQVQTAAAAAKVPATFAAFGWEMDAMLGQWNDMHDPAFIRAASHLAPALLRVGGITADWVKYTGFDGDTRGRPAAAPSPPTAVADLGGYWPNSEKNFSVANLRALLEFAGGANLSLMLDLNELHGRDCQTVRPGCTGSWCPPVWCRGRWDTTNVASLLRYIHAHGLASGTSPLYAFELGNELISHEAPQNTTADLKEAAALIQSVWADTAPADRPGLYGPSTDACSDPGQLDIMANITGVPGVAGFTFHGYPAHNGSGPNALADLLLNASWLRTGVLTGSDAIGCLDAWNAGPRARGLQLLVTEASSSYNWQLPAPAQDSVLHTLFTVAELGQYALAGVGAVGRWSLSETTPFATIRFVGSDPASGRRQYRVAADYWLLLAHKATVGPGVLNVAVPPHSPVVAYGYCAKGGFGAGGGAMVLAAVNTAATTATLDLGAIAPAPRLEYVFTAPGGNLSAVAPVLNGGPPLRLEADGGLPAAFSPAHRTEGAVTLPPRSSAYFVLLAATIPACAA